MSRSNHAELTKYRQEKAVASSQRKPYCCYLELDCTKCCFDSTDNVSSLLSKGSMIELQLAFELPGLVCNYLVAPLKTSSSLAYDDSSPSALLIYLIGFN